MLVDPTAIPGAIASAADLASRLAERLKKTQDKDQSKEVIELMQRLLEIQGAVHALLEANRNLEVRLAETEKQRQTGMELVADREVYWWTKDGQKDGPYCKVCWHRDGKLTQLMSTFFRGYYNCAICKGAFHSSEDGNPSDAFVRGRPFSSV